MSVNDREFLRAFDRSIFQTEQRYNDAIRLIALQMFNGIVLKTPVDTGRARLNWQIAVNRDPTGTIDAEPDAGSSITAPSPSSGSNRAYAEAVGRINNHSGEIDHITIANNLPYIERLEYGHSQQAPAGMVRITLTEFENILRAVAGDVET